MKVVSLFISAALLVSHPTSAFTTTVGGTGGLGPSRSTTTVVVPTTAVVTRKNQSPTTTTTQLEAADGFVVDLLSISSNPSPSIVAGAFAAVVAGIGGIFAAIGSRSSSTGNTNTNSSSKNKAGSKSAAKAAAAPPVDISIPYNSAAMLAFQEYSSSTSTSTSAAADTSSLLLFAAFEPLYLEKTVAQVSAKKIARDLEAAMEAKKATVKSVEEKMEALFAKKKE
jgi:hypothetical protein